MPRVKKFDFDEAVIARINNYIEENNLSHKKIAEASGMTYQQLYQIRKQNQYLKLREYVALCKAFNEPFDKFL